MQCRYLELDPNSWIVKIATKRYDRTGGGHDLPPEGALSVIQFCT
jgi:hypothetical protein